jgi:predicted nucleic acid-binding protein
VLDETYTLLLLNLGHERPDANIEHLTRAGLLQLVQVSPGFRDAAWQVFAPFNVDKHWSFTDCTSYVVMQQLGLGEAFAFDHHFEQMRLVRQP